MRATYKLEKAGENRKKGLAAELDLAQRFGLYGKLGTKIARC